MSLLKRITETISGAKKNTVAEQMLSQNAGSERDSAVSVGNISESKQSKGKSFSRNKEGEENAQKLSVHPDVMKLLWIGNGNQQNYQTRSSVQIQIAGTYAYIQREAIDPYQRGEEEPSLILVDLPVSRSNDSVDFTSPMVSYRDMTPLERGAYWRFLKNPYEIGEGDRAPLRLFLCGVERHLFQGNYKQAIDTLVKLLIAYPKDIGVFQASASILLSCTAHKDKILAKSFLDRVTQGLPLWKTFPFSKDIFLLTKFELGLPITASDVMHVAYAFDYKKKKHMKEDPQLFKSLVEEEITKKFKRKTFFLDEVISIGDVENCNSWRPYSLFRNYSFATYTVIPYLTHNEKLKDCIRSIIDTVHRSLDAESEDKNAAIIAPKNSEKKDVDFHIKEREIQGEKRIPFSEMETAVLADIYLKGREVYSSNVKMALIASDFLRKLAFKQGKHVDDHFRNQKGIAYQLRMMEAAFEETDGYGRRVPSGFTDIVKLYRQDKDQYQSLVSEAYRIIGELPEEAFANYSERVANRRIAGEDSSETQKDKRLNNITFVDWTKNNTTYDNYSKENESIPLFEKYGIDADQIDQYTENLMKMMLSVRLTNVLIGSDITVLKQVLQMTPAALRNIRGMGEKSYQELIQVIQTLLNDHDQYVHMEAAKESADDIGNNEGKEERLHYVNTENTPLSKHYGISEKELDSFHINLTAQGISARLINILIREDLVELCDVLRKSPVQLRGLKNLGGKSYQELIDTVQRMVVEEEKKSSVTPDNISIREQLRLALQSIPQERWSTHIAGYIKAYAKKDDKMQVLLQEADDMSVEQYCHKLMETGTIDAQKRGLNLLQWCSYDVGKELQEIDHFTIKNDRELRILNDRADGLSFEDIGKNLGITRARVQQIEKKAKNRIHEYLDEYAIILKIYAERDQDEVLTPAELTEYFGEKTPLILYVLRSEEGSDYIYDDHLDVFVVDNESLPGRVGVYLDILPDILSAQDYDKAIETGIHDKNLNKELLCKALEETYRQTGNVFSRNKLTNRSIYEQIVKRYFPDGIHVYDDEVMDEFRRYVKHEFGDVTLPDNNRAIVARIADCCVLGGRGIYRPKQEKYINQELLKEIGAYIRNQKAEIVPISTVYHVFQDQLNEEGVDNKYYLQGVLHELMGDRYDFRRDYILRKNVDTTFYLEVTEFIKGSTVPITKDALRRRYPGISDIVLTFAVSGDKEILNYFGSYFHASHLSATDEEIERVRILVQSLLNHHSQITSRDVYQWMPNALEQWRNRNHIYNQFSLFSVLQYLFRDAYQFRRPYIMKKDGVATGISMDDELNDVLREKKYRAVLEYCAAHGINTVGDLLLEHGLGELGNDGVDESILDELTILFSTLSPSEDNSKNIFEKVHPSMKAVNISALMEYGVSESIVEKLKEVSITTISDLENTSIQMVSQMVGVENSLIIRGLAPIFTERICNVLKNCLINLEETPGYQLIVNGPRQYDSSTKDAVQVETNSERQELEQFLTRLTPFMIAIVDQFMDGKDSIIEHEITDIYDNDDYDQVLMYWCNHYGYVQYNASLENYTLADEDYSEAEAEKRAEASASPIQNEGTEDVDKTIRDGIRYVLSKQFTKGFRLNSPIALRKFRRSYETLIGDELPENNETISDMISSCGICYDEMVYLPEHMADQKTSEIIKEYIQNSFDAGTKGIYYDAMYKALSDQLLDSCIYNAQMLCKYLEYVNDGTYFTHKRYLSQEANFKFDAYEEIKRVMKKQDVPITIEDVHQVLSYIPIDKIRFTMSTYDDFISNGSRQYYWIEKASITDDDLEEANRIIQINVEERKFLSGTELLRTLRQTREELFERNAILSDLGIRNAIAYYLQSQWAFNSNIISAKDSGFKMADVFAEFCKSRRQFTLSELHQLKDEVGSTIYFDDVYENSLRISEEQFVSRDQAVFDVEGTDKAIGRFCVGNYLPIDAIRQFGSFPKAGFEWNAFLLEHYVAEYSKEFTLLHGSYNANTCVGAIVKRGSGIRSFEDVLSLALAESNVKLTKDAALQFYCDNGYIARRRLSGIEQILIDAREIRNKRGQR